MRVVRIITYEGTPEQIRKQLVGQEAGIHEPCPTCSYMGAGSLRDGQYNLLTKITVDTTVVDKSEEGGPCLRLWKTAKRLRKYFIAPDGSKLNR